MPGWGSGSRCRRLVERAESAMCFKIQAEEREKLNLNRTEDDLPEDTVRYDNDESGQNAEGTREILNLHK